MARPCKRNLQYSRLTAPRGSECTFVKSGPAEGHRIGNQFLFDWLSHDGPNAISNVIDYAKFRSRSHQAMIRIYDHPGNVIETQEHRGDFKEW
jgi:hypothetical protein